MSVDPFVGVACDDRPVVQALESLACFVVVIVAVALLSTEPRTVDPDHSDDSPTDRTDVHP